MQARIRVGFQWYLWAATVMCGSVIVGRSESAKEVELYRWVDFPVEIRDMAQGESPWDVEASCTWTHVDRGITRTSLLWYSGAGNTHVFRFGASFPGKWTGRTRSGVAALDGLELEVEVRPSSNPRRTGWSGQLPGSPTAWARQLGPDGALARRTPILVMMPEVRYWHDDLQRMREFVAEFNEGHGFNGGHLSTIGAGWFEVGSGGTLSRAPETPDPATFGAIEAVAAEWSERGGWLHIWMWGKGPGGDFSGLSGGHDGRVSRRLNRYVAARLAPVPGWSMGIGWDVEFWVDESKLQWWLNDLIPQLGGWHHWIGHRYSDSDIGEGHDPEPANRGRYLERGLRWNTLRPGDEQYAGWEHWASTTSNEAIAAGLAAVPDRPMMSEDRFRRRDGKWPQKDMGADADILGEIPRWAGRGVAAIYGRLLESEVEGSQEWPNKAQIKGVIDGLEDF